MQKTTSQESHKLHQLLLELIIQYSFRTENPESETKRVSILPYRFLEGWTALYRPSSGTSSPELSTWASSAPISVSERCLTRERDEENQFPERGDKGLGRCSLRMAKGFGGTSVPKTATPGLPVALIFIPPPACAHISGGATVYSDVVFCQHQITQQWPEIQCPQQRGQVGRRAAGGATPRDSGTLRVLPIIPPWQKRDRGPGQRKGRLEASAPLVLR